MGGWRDLGVVETIYEEEQEEMNISKPHSLTTSSSFSAALSSPSSPTAAASSASSSSSLQTRVEKWTVRTGSETDVAIRVQDQCFNLHKEPLASRSAYLRHRLTASADVTISPPSGIAPETFAAVAAFCYGGDVPITPFNVASLRVAAEWLEMQGDDNEDDGNNINLLERTEWYFCQTIAANAECAATVLRKCLDLLPYAAESAAFLAGRCVETLAAADDPKGGSAAWINEMSASNAEEFQMIVESMRARLVDDHDLLYTIIAHYLEDHAGTLTEEEKTRICCAVDCRKLSRPRLVHLVLNHMMPLRFVVQAMLIEQLHTRRSVLDNGFGGSMTLGEILQREAAVRRAEQIKDTMEATSIRIRSLESELAGLRRRLKEAEEETSEESGELELGSMGVKSESFRFFREEEKKYKDGLVVYSEKSGGIRGDAKSERGFGRTMMHKLRKVFRTTARSGAERGSMSCKGDGDVVAAEELRLRPTHRRNRSLV